MPGQDKVAIVAGATGAVGSALTSHLATQGGWKVVGVARRAPAQPVEGVSYALSDMADPIACSAALAYHPHATHLFYCARATHQDEPVESTSANLGMLSGVVEAVERVSDELRHVHLVQGGKYYGVHLGPFPTPAREGQGRCQEPNFNHAQQDYLQERCEDSEWSWSACRPNTLLHFSPHIARNIVSTLGCYAAICGELGVPFDFPGPRGAFTSLSQVTTLDVLARSMERIATDRDCAGKAFNITNTDVFRWTEIWSGIRARFGLRLGTVQAASLKDTMAGNESVWRRVCERHGLQLTTMDEVANWSFADATLERTWDEILSHNRARRHGLDGWDDSVRRFLGILDLYREARLLP